MILTALFALAALGGICGLTAVAPRAVPPVTASTAFILTLAVLGMAALR